MAKPQVAKPIPAGMRRQIQLIATVIVCIFTVGLAGIVWLLKAPLIPAIDDIYDISDHFNAQLTEHVQQVVEKAQDDRADLIDSGYSESFRFKGGQQPTPETLLFFARQGQEVRVIMSAVPIQNRRDMYFEALVDGMPWDTLLVPDRDGPIRSQSQGPISSKLRPAGSEHENVHEVRIVPLETAPMDIGEDVIVNVLVLVSARGSRVSSSTSTQ